MELTDTAPPGKIAEAANIMAVDAARGAPAHRTRRRGGTSADGHNDAIMGDNDLINGEACKGRMKFGPSAFSVHPRCGPEAK
jgi:hypothetical protein